MKRIEPGQGNDHSRDRTCLYISSVIQVMAVSVLQAESSWTSLFLYASRNLSGDWTTKAFQMKSETFWIQKKMPSTLERGHNLLFQWRKKKKNKHEEILVWKTNTAPVCFTFNTALTNLYCILILKAVFKSIKRINCSGTSLKWTLKSNST